MDLEAIAYVRTPRWERGRLIIALALGCWLLALAPLALAAECTGWVNPDDSIVWEAANGWTESQFCANAMAAVSGATSCSSVGSQFSLCLGEACYPFVHYPVGCGADDELGASIIPLADALELAWGIGAAWLFAAMILFLRRSIVS
jgi:hypothetical protein